MASTTLLKSLLLLFSLFISLPPSSSSLILNTTSIPLLPNILTLLLQSLKTAISQGAHLSDLLSTADGPTLVQKQIGAVQDCKELHQVTLSSLHKTIFILTTADNTKLADARAFLSGALTKRMTCLEGLHSATWPSKSTVINSLTTFYEHVTSALSLLPKMKPRGCFDVRRRRLLGFPRWLPAEARQALQGSGGGVDRSRVITVAADGTGDFTTVSGAINFAPNNSIDRIIVHVRRGVYRENVEIPSWKMNIFLVGDGRDETVISGSRSAGDGWTTFRSATVAVSGEGFLARDIKFENMAGPAKGQAVALRINAGRAALYRCTMTGYQDTLYVHSFRQMYRECDIYRTIDYIFGNSAVVLQECNIICRLAMRGQFVVITAQGREDRSQDTGISIQKCRILATDELKSNSTTVRSYLGRPWKNYSRTVSYIDGFIHEEGWSEWKGDQGLDTLYYGEYENYGPGSSTKKRVSWPGYDVMTRDEACNFTVSMFIDGEEWLDSTPIPYDDGL